VNLRTQARHQLKASCCAAVAYSGRPQWTKITRAGRYAVVLRPRERSNASLSMPSAEQRGRAGAALDERVEQAIAGCASSRWSALQALRGIESRCHRLVAETGDIGSLCHPRQLMLSRSGPARLQRRSRAQAPITAWQRPCATVASQARGTIASPRAWATGQHGKRD